MTTANATPAPPAPAKGRLGNGQLRRQVAEYLADNAGTGPLKTGEIAKALGRSAGAVGNALNTLVERGEAELLPGKPARYLATATTAAAAAIAPKAPLPPKAAPAPKPDPSPAPAPAPHAARPVHHPRRSRGHPALSRPADGLSLPAAACGVSSSAQHPAPG